MVGVSHSTHVSHQIYLDYAIVVESLKPKPLRGPNLTWLHNVNRAGREREQFNFVNHGTTGPHVLDVQFASPHELGFLLLCGECTYGDCVHESARPNSRGPLKEVLDSWAATGGATSTIVVSVCSGGNYNSRYNYA